VAYRSIAFLILARIGAGRWAAWDADARAAARRLVPGKADGRVPAVTFLVLAAVAVAMSAATFAYLWR
jgi:hypothetical protein